MSTNPNYIAMRDWLEEHEPTPDDLIELIQAERERCAKIAEALGASRTTRSMDGMTMAGHVADAIRRGGEHEHNE